MSTFALLPLLLALHCFFLSIISLTAHAQNTFLSGLSNNDNPPIELQAQQITGHLDRVLKLDHQVQITHGTAVVDTEHATYHIVDNTIDAPSCVRLQQDGNTYTGENLLLNMDSWLGTLLRPTYQLILNQAHGRAQRVEFQDKNRARFFHGTYTTCPKTAVDWYVKTNVLDIDMGRNEGVARGGVLVFKGVSLLPAPWLSFSLSNERRSGFLPPIFGMSNKGGIEINLPYYLNIAPNRDVTVYANVISRRGLQAGAQARYLGQGYSGHTQFEFLPHDKLTRTNRYAIDSQHTQYISRIPGLSMQWNIRYASDDRYPDDFARGLRSNTQRLLNRQWKIDYANEFGKHRWRFSALASRYQLLQDFDNNGRPRLVRPYDRLPQVTFSTGKTGVAGFDWSLDAQYTKFWQSNYRVRTTRPYSPHFPLGGQRVFINPSLSYPLRRVWGFFIPKIQWDATAYHLFGVPEMPGNKRVLHRSLPIFSVDSGLIFERDTGFIRGISDQQPLIQTLEPRLFYVRMPFRDQSNFPLFDAAATDFNFAQIFTENRFIGHDRMSDANQLTAAVTTRFIEPNGQEQLRFMIGQRFHFVPPRVSLDNKIENSRSDILFSAGGRIFPILQFNNLLQYSQTSAQWMRANTMLSWRLASKKVFNVAYRLDRTTNTLALNNNEVLKQIDVSAQWPLFRRWYGVGRVNYSLSTKRLVDALAGLEYRADCWIFRLVAQRSATSAQSAISSMFIQLELNGLSKLGSSPLSVLRSSISGYQPTNMIE